MLKRPRKLFTLSKPSVCAAPVPLSAPHGVSQARPAAPVAVLSPARPALCRVQPQLADVMPPPCTEENTRPSTRDQLPPQPPSTRSHLCVSSSLCLLLSLCLCLRVSESLCFSLPLSLLAPPPSLHLCLLLSVCLSPLPSFRAWTVTRIFLSFVFCTLQSTTNTVGV